MMTPRSLPSPFMLSGAQCPCLYNLGSDITWHQGSMGGSLGDTLDTRLDVRYLETTETDNRYRYQTRLSCPSRHMTVLSWRSEVCSKLRGPGPLSFPLIMISASWWNAATIHCCLVYSRYYFHIFIFHEVLSSMEPRHPPAPRRNAEGEVEEDEVAGSSGSTTSYVEWGPGSSKYCTGVWSVDNLAANRVSPHTAAASAHMSPLY